MPADPNQTAGAAAANPGSVAAPSAGSPGVNPNAQASPATAASPNAATQPGAGLGANANASTQPDAGAQRLAALARRERALQHRAEEFRRQQAADSARVKAESDRLDAQRREVEELRTWREKAKTDPLEAMKFLGHTYESLTEAQMNGGKLPPEKLLAVEGERLKSEFTKAQEARDAELKSIRERQEAFEKQQQAAFQAQQQQQVAEFTNNVSAYVKGKAEDYQYINANEAWAQVPDLIMRYHQQSFEADVPAARAEGREPQGKALTADEAAKMLEEHFEAQAARFTQTKKFLGKWKAVEQPAAAAAAGAAAATGQQPAQGSTQGEASRQQVSFETKRGGVTFERSLSGQRPTITNAASTSPSPAAASTPMTEAERMKRAIAAYDASEASRRASVAHV